MIGMTLERARALVFHHRRQVLARNISPKKPWPSVNEQET
jgi:hypothetical protein